MRLICGEVLPGIARRSRLVLHPGGLTLQGVHELAIMDSLVSAVSERVGQARVRTVRLEIGRLSAVVPEALRFCFEVSARGTVLEGATLEIDEIPGRARCGRCDKEWCIDSLADGLANVCPCGGVDLRVTAGEELRVKNLELL